MSIVLEKVELKNIRSHESIVFEPIENGVTAISGPNGTGKSSIVDSVAWALYGIKPQGVGRIASIARLGSSPGKDEVFAKVWLKIDEVELFVERRIVTKAGAVECEIWEKRDDEWERLAGPAVSHVEPVIRKRIGMNSQGFLSAVLVQQKQVDQLILAGPKERTQVIERLTGIDSITHAQQTAREEYNKLRKLLSNTPASENVEELEESLDEISREKDKADKKKTQIEAHNRKLHEDLKVSSSDLERQEKLRETSRKLSDKKLKAETTLEEVQNTLTGVVEERDDLKERVSKIIVKDVSEISKNLSKKESDLDEVKKSLAFIAREEEENSASAKKSKKILGSSNLETVEEAKLLLKKLSKEFETLVRKEEAASKKLLENQANVSQLESAIEVLLKSDECPTCLQRVPDVTTAVSDLESRISEIDTSTVQVESSKVSERVEEVELVIEAFQTLSSVESNAAENSKRKDKLLSKRKILEEEVKQLREQYVSASYNEETVSRYENLSKKARELTVRKNNLIRAVSDAESKIESLDLVSDSAFSRISKKVAEQQRQLSREEVVLTELNGSIDLLKERYRNAKKELAAAKEAKEKYDGLLESVEVASSNASLLEEFRVNRINTSIPLLERYASDFINRFTEGKFSGIKLDAKFNTSVVLADGTVRPIGLLSGGELSAASIALRLAISLLLSPENSGLIILDEVLVSQDGDRAEIILNTISEINAGQVIIIAHNDTIDGIADKVITLGDI